MTANLIGCVTFRRLHNFPSQGQELNIHLSDEEFLDVHITIISAALLI